MHVPSFPEIDGLCKAFHGAKKPAVENFLLSLDPKVSQDFHRRNLSMDARLYGWGRATVDAIAAGIRLAYGGRAR